MNHIEVYCNECQKVFKSHELHDLGHFKSFLYIPPSMIGCPIVKVLYFGADRKVLEVSNKILNKNFIYKIYYGGLSDIQIKAFERVLEIPEHQNLSMIVPPIQANEENSEIILIFENLDFKFELFVEQYPEKTSTYFAKFFLEICKGLKHLHTNGLIHGNMDLTSLFIEDLKSKKIKLGSLDKTLCEEDLKNLDEVEIGNRNVMAPEIIEGKKEIDFKKVDVWNLGIIMFQFLFKNRNPFQGANLMETQNNIVTRNFSKELDSQEKKISLIRECFNDIEKRPSLDDVLNKLSTMLDK